VFFSDFRPSARARAPNNTSGLRYYVRLHASGPVIVAQRLKRLPTIPRQAQPRTGHEAGPDGRHRRLPRSSATPQNVRDIADHLRRRRKKEIVRLRDYMAKPKPKPATAQFTWCSRNSVVVSKFRFVPKASTTGQSTLRPWTVGTTVSSSRLGALLPKFRGTSG